MLEISDEKLKAGHPELFLLCKNYWHACKNEIMKDPRNAHLRRETRQEG